MEIFIYRRISPSGKVYIGQTSDSLEKRAGKDGIAYLDSPYLYKAIEKYGWDSFVSDVLYVASSKEEANEKERQLIDEYMAYDPEFGYNLTYGGDGGVPTEATRQKLREARLGKPAATKGRKLRTEEQKEHLRQLYIGKPRSEEVKAKMRATIAAKRQLSA